MRRGGLSLFNLLDPLRGIPVRKRVLVNMKSGTSFEGVVWERHGGILLLRDARISSDLGNPVPKPITLDGSVLLLVDAIDFIQVVD